MFLVISILTGIVLSRAGIESVYTGYREREPKFLFLFPFYRVLPGLPCTTKDNLDGICLSQRQCNARAGTGSGNCGYKGVCCVHQRTCSENSNANNTYFFSPNYPAAFSSGKSCSVTIQKMSSEICQLRIDFLEFSISEPNPVTGTCDNDKLDLNIPNNPVLCGENGGHHVYIDFKAGANTHSISVTTVNAVPMSRRWNLKVSQIACNSSERENKRMQIVMLNFGFPAPSGCLKYFTNEKGSDRSFNFSPLPTVSEIKMTLKQRSTKLPVAVDPGVSEPNLKSIGNRQISGLSYGVCVRKSPGSCAITWSRSSANNYTFSISGATNTSDQTGSGSTGFSGSANCTSNFIIIPNGKQNKDGKSEDRYCGNNLSPVTTSSSPFVMTVVTSFNESNSNNRGFLLEYNQNPCLDGNR